MSNKLVETQTRTDRAIERLIARDEPVMEDQQAAIDALNAEITYLNTNGQPDLASNLTSIAVMFEDAHGDANKLMVEYRDMLIMLGEKVRDLRQAVHTAERDAANNYNSGFYAGMKSKDKEVDALKKRLAKYDNWYNTHFANTGS